MNSKSLSTSFDSIEIPTKLYRSNQTLFRMVLSDLRILRRPDTY